MRKFPRPGGRLCRHVRRPTAGHRIRQWGGRNGRIRNLKSAGKLAGAWRLDGSAARDRIRGPLRGSVRIGELKRPRKFSGTLRCLYGRRRSSLCRNRYRRRIHCRFCHRLCIHTRNRRWACHTHAWIYGRRLRRGGGSRARCHGVFEPRFHIQQIKLGHRHQTRGAFPLAYIQQGRASGLLEQILGRQHQELGAARECMQQYRCPAGPFASSPDPHFAIAEQVRFVILCSEIHDLSG